MHRPHLGQVSILTNSALSPMDIVDGMIEQSMAFASTLLCNTDRKLLGKDLLSGRTPAMERPLH